MGTIIIVFFSCLFFYLLEHTKDKNKAYENDSLKLNDLNGQITPWGQHLVGIDTEKGKKIKVAILDSGINDNHEDLLGKVYKKYNTINPQDGVHDDLGHGTAVAGIITANNNAIGIVGITQNVEIYDVKVLNEEGKGNIEDLIAGINWSIKEEVDILNISFGVQSNNELLEEAIKEAVSKGIIVVAAAGNTFGLSVDYPAKYENVLSVSSIDEDLNRISTSAKGKIDFVAPGRNILSTSNNGSYDLFEGTSFSTPYLTGVIAATLSHRQETYSSEEIIQKFKQSATYIGTKEEHIKYGNGLLKYGGSGSQ
ncbi:S8 family peptidase [Sutcliffiella halmapala]|uniref:S8 family peptidase n=1 Tax=Sutcliffiella halmapala TaxID=79882 RepID=UPI0009953EAB|nr:S8 family peptidase [Sutcliffiella halmapala]